MTTGMIALAGLAVLFIGWIVTLVIPELRFVSWSLLAVGVIFILVAVVLDYRRVGRALVSRRGRFGTGTTLMVSVFTGIILLVNAISIGNFYRFDTTGLSQYTLASQTKEMLANLEQPVEVIQFTVPSDEYRIGAHASTLLAEYQNFTDELDVKVVDPDEHPDQARQHNITEYHSVVFIGEAGERLVSPLEIALEAEHAFTSAILEVTGAVQMQVYFITGHGEGSIYDISPAGYTNAREGLKDNLFKTAELDLLEADLVPEDAAALVLVAPKPEQPLTEGETALILRYLIGGGRLLVLANPDRPDEINQIVAAWGILVDNRTLIDPSSYTAPNLNTPSVDRNRNSVGLATTYFPGTTAILAIEPVVPYVQHQPMVWTTEDAYLDGDYDPDVPSRYDEETDTRGTQIIGILAGTMPPQPEDPDEPVTIPEDFVDNRLIVIGDSDFAANRHFFNGGNGDLFLTSINWLTLGTELISIDQKFLQQRRLILRPEAKVFIDISSMALLPLLVFVAGGIIWYRRR